MRKVVLQLHTADARGVVASGGAMICPLNEATAATVRREINGEYSLTVKMPPAAANIDEIQIGRAIKAAVNEAGKEQYFIIKRRRRSLSGGIDVYAEHQSYYYNGCILRGGGASAAGTPALTYNQVWNNAHPDVRQVGTFTNHLTGKTTTQKVVPMVTSPSSVREQLLGRLIDTFGGEMDFDGFNVDWKDALGADNGALYRYGYNLTEMESEDVLDGYASGVFPFWGSIDPRTNAGIVTISGWTLNFPGTFPLEVIIPLDLTKQFDTEPTAAQLEAAAQEYIAQHTTTGVPISITANRARIEGDVPVDLGDTVTVVNTPWGISQKTRIFALNFDALRCRVESVEFGTVNPGFAGAVKNMK